MAPLPPPIREADFAAVDIIDEEEIKRRFNPLVRSLHDYLNQLPCLRDIQQVRRQWKARTAEKTAFGNLASHGGEWYTYHCGGRNEAHFNLCLRPQHFSVGLGFEFSLNKGGDPTVVQLAYACFTNVVKSRRAQFEAFVEQHQLEIEWCDDTGSGLQYVPNAEVVNWLNAPPKVPRWICIARFLRAGRDAVILEDPEKLGAVIEPVLAGFRPYWEQTQVMARSLR
jgi:hypothetical protein